MNVFFFFRLPLFCWVIFIIWKTQGRCPGLDGQLCVLFSIITWRFSSIGQRSGWFSFREAQQRWVYDSTCLKKIYFRNVTSEAEVHDLQDRCFTSDTFLLLSHPSTWLPPPPLLLLLLLLLLLPHLAFKSRLPWSFYITSGEVWADGEWRKRARDRETERNREEREKLKRLVIGGNGPNSRLKGWRVSAISRMLLLKNIGLNCCSLAESIRSCLK